MMYVLKTKKGLHSSPPQVVRCEDGHTVTLWCIATSSQRTPACLIFVYEETIYSLFISDMGAVFLYRICPNGESMHHVRAWFSKTGDVIDTRCLPPGLLTPRRLSAYIIPCVIFRGSSVVFAVHGCLYFQLDMKTLELVVTKEVLNITYNISVKLDGSVEYYKIRWRPSVSLEYDDSGKIVVGLDGGTLHHKLLFGEHNNIYLYYGGIRFTFQSMVLVDSCPCDMVDFASLDNGNGVHIGYGCRDMITIWDPRDGATYDVSINHVGESDSCNFAVISR